MAMARNRRRKAGSLRIDAALAAMRPMGFSNSVVRKHVKELLKVYGGEEEGWYFIEEASYKLLIDTILDGQAEQECATNLLTYENAIASGETGSKNLVLYEAGKTGADGASTSSTAGSESLLLLCDKPEPDAQTAVKYDCLKVDYHKIEENDRQDDTVVQPGTQDSNANGAYGDGNRASTGPIRKQCYGWISDDDEEYNHNDFIFLAPANGTQLSSRH